MTERIRAAVFEALTDLAPEVESLDEIDSAADLREQVDLDSMDYLNLITALAERFSIEIPETDYRQLYSFDGIVAYLRQKT